MKSISARGLLVTLVPAAAILLLTAAVSLFGRIDPGNLTRDVAAIGNVHPLFGFLSNLGILLWCIAGAVSAFAAAVRGRGRPSAEFWFLIASALLSAYLLFDDLFMFHEALAPQYLGLSEKAPYAFLAIAALVYVVAFRRIILRTKFWFLLLALGFLAAALLIDVATERWLVGLFGPWEYLVEDGAKWLGIACWCSYCVQTAYDLLAAARPAPASL